ncbi:hypothetical protein CEXT_642791 [Caerostris extrusa]|uniref:Uncharacterized protein n=1 Tax=Caerostris extrusa TaxID=172846 RepID=A0AAV4WMS2_CAEEX|nr:hypothetical protein CEXT_642791 [Caerostris extrusa]
MVQGAPPTPSLVPTTGNRHNHQIVQNQVPNSNSDAATKAIYVLNELISIFNSLRGLDNMFTALAAAKDPLEKLAAVLSIQNSNHAT